MTIALITGISGQDGSYLAEYLLSLNYEVHGLVRRHSQAENQSSRLENIFDKITLHYGDLTDVSSLERIITQVKPDEIYNLAAQSHVKVSFDVPSYTMNVNCNGVINILETVRRFCPKCKFYQASSSEMFGNSYDEDMCQRETTQMKPVSPYACSKLAAHTICSNYRNSYNLFICCGILFNHESPRRGTNFVTNKVVKGAVRIKLNLQENLRLGNLESKRDWGHAQDYIKAMHLMLNQENAKDWVVSTMKTYSVRDLCDYVFNKLELNYKDYVISDQKYLRPEELKYLKGDSSKIREELGWKPNYTFETMLDEMIEYWMNNYKIFS